MEMGSTQEQLWVEIYLKYHFSTVYVNEKLTFFYVKHVTESNVFTKVYFRFT